MIKKIMQCLLCLIIVAIAVNIVRMYIVDDPIPGYSSLWLSLVQLISCVLMFIFSAILFGITIEKEVE